MISEQQNITLKKMKIEKLIIQNDNLNLENDNLNNKKMTSRITKIESE